MRDLFLIFLGGGLGSTLRYLASILLNKGHKFPLGTFAVNIIGSLLIGYVISLYFEDKTHWARLMFVVGFCGGFTTFSTFSLDTLTLIKQQDYGIATLYIVASVVLSISATYIGFVISKFIHN